MAKAVYIGISFNEIPKSTDESGNIYNGKGYIENTYINAGTEMYVDGISTTGFIPFEIGDTVYFKNMEFGKVANHRIVFYDSNKTYLGFTGGNATYYTTSVWTSTLDDNNCYTSMTPTSTAASGTAEGTAYIRICAPGIDADSIITIDQEPPDTAAECEIARNVPSMYIGIDNVARKIKKGYIGDENGIARLFWETATSLNDMSWARIKEIADAQEGPNYFAVGDMKAVTLNGTVGALTLSNFTCYCFIIGFDHNSSREGTGIHFQFGKLEDGTDIMFVDRLYNQGHVSGGFRMVTGSQNYDWYSSYMRKTICPAFLKTLPSDLQAVISSCKKFQSLWIEYEDYPEDNYYSVTTSTYTTDKIWLLGWFEVYSSSSSYNYVNSSEKSYQTQYAYYAAGNSKSKYPHNNPTGTCWGWWTRSPMESGGSGFMKAGTTFTFDYADYSLGFAPGFKV